MEAPNERQKWDRLLVVVTNPNDHVTLEKVVARRLARESRLIAKKATTIGIGSSTQVNDQIDQVINELSDELLKVQNTVQAGGKLTICGAAFFLRRLLNAGQLKRAKREFAHRVIQRILRRCSLILCHYCFKSKRKCRRVTVDNRARHPDRLDWFFCAIPPALHCVSFRLVCQGFARTRLIDIPFLFQRSHPCE
jgi:hypothetical protein